MSSIESRPVMNVARLHRMKPPCLVALLHPRLVLCLLLLLLIDLFELELIVNVLAVVAGVMPVRIVCNSAPPISACSTLLPTVTSVLLKPSNGMRLRRKRRLSRMESFECSDTINLTSMLLRLMKTFEPLLMTLLIRILSRPINSIHY